MKKLLSILPVAVLLASCQSAAVLQINANDARIPRIKAAAVKMAGVQKSGGNYAALDAIKACEKRALKPAASLEDAQTCAAQDWVISKTSIEVLSKLGGATGDRSYIAAKGAPVRVSMLLSNKGYSKAQVEEFVALIDQFGVPAFAKARF
jgi:hypothetical protein